MPRDDIKICNISYYKDGYKHCAGKVFFKFFFYIVSYKKTLFFTQKYDKI